MTHAELKAATKLILGLPFLADDSWCPRCDQVLDMRSSHSRACMSGGDIVRLHNELRDMFYTRFLSAGMACERELRGLLPDESLRRPGDLHLPVIQEARQWLWISL